MISNCLDERFMVVSVDEPQKRPGDNPWYLLATLYGRPVRADRELQTQNCKAWNRYILQTIDVASLASLSQYKTDTKELAVPFTPEEVLVIGDAYKKRHREEGGTASLSPPNPNIFNIGGMNLDFSNVNFDRFSQFDGYVFPVQANFSRSSFASISFRNSVLLKAAFFEDAKFSDSSFQETKFVSTASFENATFSSAADFRSAIFLHWAFFQKVTFSNDVSFSEAVFSSWALFERATFSEDSSFNEARFYSLSRFVNAKMDGPTSFANAVFAREPPHFSGAKLHEGTVFRGVKWPIPSGNNKNAGIFVDAYERLKLEMDKLRKHGDELDFFILELKSRRKLAGDWLSYPEAALAFVLYGFLSDFGRSYSRPLWGLLFTTGSGFALLYWHFGMYHFGTAMALGFANTLGALGFRKDFFAPALIEGLPAWLKVVAALQTVIGTFLLFLLGLALRNRFRTK